MRSGSARGFAYIGLLIGMIIVGIGLAAVSRVWSQGAQREREAELLFVGHQFRQAITRYYLESPPGKQGFPSQIADLLQDSRRPDAPRRHLRRLYTDPMTGTTDWGEVRLPNGQLVGVYSRSSEEPIKTAQFSAADHTLEGARRYTDWIFRSPLPAANPAIAPAAGYGTVWGSVAPARPGQKAPSPSANIPPPKGVILPVPRTR